MEYLLVMSFSGSTMVGIYLLLRRLFDNRICARLYYLLAKTAVLFYLVPLPSLKVRYREVFWALRDSTQEGAVLTPAARTNYVIRAGGKTYFNAYAKFQLAVLAVWLCGFCLLLLWLLVGYLRTVRLAARFAVTEMTDCQRETLIRIKEQCSVKRHVTLYQGAGGMETMTFGFFRPVIVCGEEVGSQESELLLRHEMVHIRRWDTLWKVLMQSAALLHWWNPAAWLLYRDFGRVCECSCDEEVMQGKSEEEVRAYLRLLVREAQRERTVEATPLRWRAGFGNSGKRLEERIKNLMKRKKWNRLAAGMLVGVLAFANSVTVFAYRDVYEETAAEEITQEEIERNLHMDAELFVPDGAVGEEVQGSDLQVRLELRYDEQFIDEEGNIYPVTEEPSARSGCSHTYVSGKTLKHIKASDGGCEVVEYRSQRCSKCGNTLLGERIARYLYDVCPHE